MDKKFMSNEFVEGHIVIITEIQSKHPDLPALRSLIRRLASLIEDIIF